MRNRKENLFFGKAFLILFFSLFIFLSFPGVSQPGEPDSEKILTAVRRDIQSSLALMDSNIAAAAKSLSKAGIKSKKARFFVSRLYKSTPLAIDCVTVNEKGKIIIVEPAPYRKFAGADISKQEQIIRLQKERKPVISNVFRAVEGMEAADFEYPVFFSSGKFAGSVSVLFRPEKLIGDAIAKTARNAPVEIWAMQPDGRIIYDSDSDEIGRMLFTDSLYRPYASLLELGKKIAAEKEGTGEYVFLAKGHKETIKKKVVWKTVAMHGMQWRMVAVSIDHGDLSKDIIRLGVVTKSGSAQNICAEKFKELLEARSSYKVRIFDNGSLGTESAILRQLQSGSIQLGVITSGPVDEFVPTVRVIEYPFLFQSYNDVDKLLDGQPGKKLLASLEKSGFAGLAFSENGFRHLTNSKKRVHRAADVQGLKIRVMESEFHKTLWKLLGATALPLGWPINKALQQGIIDGQENPLSVIWTYQLFSVQKYLTLTSHVYSAHIDMANLQWFRSLPEKDRQQISACMVEAAKYQRQWNRDNEAGFLNNLKKAGMVVNEKPDIASFREKLAAIQDTDMYRDSAVREILREFLNK